MPDAPARENRQAATEALEHAQRMVRVGGFDRLLELQSINRTAHAKYEESLAEIRLDEARLGSAEATSSVVDLIRPAR